MYLSVENGICFTQTTLKESRISLALAYLCTYILLLPSCRNTRLTKCGLKHTGNHLEPINPIKTSGFDLRNQQILLRLVVLF